MQIWRRDLPLRVARSLMSLMNQTPFVDCECLPGYRKQDSLRLLRLHRLTLRAWKRDRWIREQTCLLDCRLHLAPMKSLSSVL
jgi:hypothetical protein